MVFHWNQAHDAAFKALMLALIAASVLALPNFSKIFYVETDASDCGVGAVLMQDKHPVAYISKSLGPKLRGLSTYENEYVAILLATEQWGAYLQYGEFHIYTNHKSLSHLNEQRLHTPWQQKVFTKLLGLQHKIIYKKGIENATADALSHKPDTSVTSMAISSCQPQWLDELEASYEQDSYAKDIIAKLTLFESAVPQFSWSQGVLHYKKRIWVGADSTIQLKLIAAFHESTTGGHSGVLVTCRRLKQYFA
jgi:hypothetical protein